MDDQLRIEIDRIIDFIYSETPDARVVDTGDIFEGESANLEVYPPLHWSEETCSELQEKIAEQAVEPLIKYGYLILTYVYKPEQQVQAAKSQLDSAVKSAKSAKKILATAIDLGLLNKETILPELTLA